MQVNEKVKSGYTRITETLSKRPSFGHATVISKATIKNGLTCEIREGEWTMTADMPEQVGGNAVGPAPGVFGRAALGSCLAIGYMIWAAAMDIPIAGIEVEVQADYDNGILFGTTQNVPSGYTEIRYTVTIDSDAPDETIMNILDEADSKSPWLGNFQNTHVCHREVNIISQKQF